MVFKWYARPCKASLHCSLLFFCAPPLVNTPLPWNHLRFCTHALSFQAGVSLLMLFLESSSLLSPHIEFVLILWASAQIPSLLGNLSRRRCSLLHAIKASGSISLAASWCSRSYFLVLCIPVFVIQWTACSSRAQVLFWYFQVICNSGGSMSSLLNKQMGGVASAKAGAPPLATDIEAGQFIRWQDWD